MLKSKLYIHEILIFSEERTESQKETLSSPDLPHRTSHTTVREVPVLRQLIIAVRTEPSL